jgi:hypothetical protein
MLEHFESSGLHALEHVHEAGFDAYGLHTAFEIVRAAAVS